MRKCETNKMSEIIGFILTSCNIFSYSHYSHIYYYYYFSVCMYVCVEAKKSEKHEKMRISDKVYARIGFSHTFCVSHLSHRENVQHFVGDIRMNLFYLDWDINEIVKSMNNKHIVKMLLESAQMLCTAHWCHNRNVKELKDLYRPVHVNHPTTIWTRKVLFSILSLQFVCGNVRRIYLQIW